jgi:RNA polymerase sigma factor (sigma-70 family)
LLRLGWLLRQKAQTPTESAAQAPPADRAALGAETRDQVRQSVASLPARDREVIVLRYFEQMEVAEIAQVLGLKRGAVEVRLHRARERLRVLLPACAEDDEHATRPA